MMRTNDSVAKWWGRGVVWKHTFHTTWEEDAAGAGGYVTYCIVCSVVSPRAR